MEIIDGLLDDEAFDAKKLFDETEYSTLIINRDGFTKKENETADLLQVLLDKKTTREEKEEVFSALKKAQSQKLLTETIRSTKRMDEKAILAAACWESGLDFTPYYVFFTELACGEDFQLGMEALTVIENCEGPFEKQVLEEALTIAQNSSSKHQLLLNDLVESIQSHLSAN